mmetsp:Transcript_7340/g.18651  ORF Transcript_7340/g.18651 Transcript_7340/m.18651 type:complete len:369 (+) Transcript_7340:100-1206(+)
MAACLVALLSTGFHDMVFTPLEHPLRAVKWVAPLVWCFAAFCFQSVMLHQATLLYVLNHSTVDDVLVDVGHDILGNKVVPMKVLDMISFSAMSCFFFGCALIRDLRLWVKVFMCCGFLFFWKGLLDYITDLPDSGGWHTCEKRLGPSGVHYFEGFRDLHGSAYWSRLMDMEFHGVDGTWPVRYCSDMILSGHTFVMFLFLLGCADLTRKLRLLMPGVPMRVAEILVNVAVICCVCTDLYLIVVNHFHYTVDVVLAIVMTLLFYTNAGIAILTDWWVEKWEDTDDVRYTEDNGSIWLPPLLLPCCAFQGFYTVRRKDRKDVREAFKVNLPQEVLEFVPEDRTYSDSSEFEEEEHSEKSREEEEESCYSP